MDFLVFKNGKLLLEKESFSSEPGEIVVVTDLEQVLGLDCMCSSSVDFPEDETDDENLIAICMAIRS